jgi:hypothetical protein
MSPVACNVDIAHECLKLCGDIRFFANDGCLALAVRTCLSRMYSNPDRVMASPRMLGKRAGVFGSAPGDPGPPFQERDTLCRRSERVLEESGFEFTCQ